MDADIRFGDKPVAVGMIQYVPTALNVGPVVAPNFGAGPIACHVVTALVGTKVVRDFEGNRTVWVFRVRAATAAEEAAYLAVPRAACRDYRVEV